MGWFPGGSASVSNTASNSKSDYTPVLSDQWVNAYNNASGNLNAGGASANQQTAIDWTRNDLVNSTVGHAADTANAGISDVRDNYYKPLAARGANTLGAYFKDPVQGTVTDSANTNDVHAGTGADYMSRYTDPWQRDVVDTSLADYDAGVGQGFAALRGQNAGAFGNKRTGVAESNYLDAATRGRGSLAAGIRSQGFQSAAGYGATDATRALTADTTNAANLLNNNQFNAGQHTQMSLANANLLDSRQKFDLNQADENTDRQVLIAGKMAGIDQSILDNIVTAHGVDVSNAENLFQAGIITQDQLNALTKAAEAANGSKSTSSSNSTTIKAEVHAG